MSDKFCLDLTHDELKTWCREKNIPAFRADQIYRWLSSGVINLDEMTNIPLSLRQMLNADFVFGSMTCVRKLVSEIDGTVKFVYQTDRRQCHRNGGNEISHRSVDLHFFPGWMQDGMQLLRFCKTRFRAFAYFRRDVRSGYIVAKRS